MKITTKKIEDLVKYLIGEDIIPLVKKLKGQENISEFKLAKQLKKDIKVIRNMLYRLYDINLVEFTRKKDKEKGWYIYYWTFKPEHIRFLSEKIRKEHLEKLRERLSREKNEQFFICPNACVRLNFDQAINFEFKCPECGQLANQENTSKLVDELQKRIKELEKTREKGK